MYLAQRGLKTGNVPIIPDLPLPRPLFELDPSKVFGLVADPARLLMIRQARMRTLGAPPWLDYANAESISRELEDARRLFRARGWRLLDVSGRAVEENASRILELHERSLRS
jgi:hypothetical protein